MHAAEQADARPGDGVCVFGCGPIGLAAITALVDRSHENVVAVDLSPTRRALASQLGAQAALDPMGTSVWDALADLHGTKPFMLGPTPATAAFIEASGSASVINDVISHAAVGARLSVVALHYEPIATSYLNVLMRTDDPRLLRVPSTVRRRDRPVGAPGPLVSGYSRVRA
jgi:threonine dehydrogenase-like Zn-dependent dehydrogenase